MIPAKYWSPTKKLVVLGAMVGGKLVEDTETGNPLTFITDVSKPLKSLLIPFTPQQEGTGDPSPSNIRSILPWNGLTVFGGGKNLLSDSAVNYGSWGTDGSEIQNDNNKYRRLSVNLPAGNYVFSTDTTNCYIIRILIDDTVVGTGGALQSKNFTLTASANVKIAWRNTDTSEISGTLHNQIELGSSASAYEPYNQITDTDIVFPSPVYGGTLDVVSGVLTVEWATKQFDGSSDENWYFVQVGSSSWYKANIIMSEAKQPNDISAFADSYKAVSFNNRSYSSKVCMFGNENESPIIFNVITELTTLEDFKAYLAENPLTIAYKLATPQEIQLTPAQITALVGNNTIWSDADGSMTATYLKKA